ncbi:membrane protein insertase, YidC/Oxa1 family [Neorickettsia helminthoeca str. Oregon]|uniref:Membrane protein insertase YidC n=1 Tax=Neorickettsia helminthoeca str. Oregon TaxID=1286528 RepID=X5H3R1_9RICK|nr:membrane protein insertase YidC [Neorickettsia helminthoeca]AHX11333.1 membrane protein insertase, YidC/Oxa1 family [Neorickettsia helminthoeca str. Oregon]
MQQTYNVFIATFLSFLVIIGWNLLFDSSAHRDAPREATNKTKVKVYDSIEDSLKADRVILSNGKLQGSILLKGLVLDNLSLKEYKSDDGTDRYQLLRPVRTASAYSVNPGWSTGNDVELKTPDSNTQWKSDGTSLTPENPVTFFWDNGSGLLFKVLISIDDKYMFTFKQTVENKSSNDLSVAPHFTITKQSQDTQKSMLIMHEGPIGVIKDKLIELKYNKLVKKNKSLLIEEDPRNYSKWFGFSEKYWLVSQILRNPTEGKVYISHSLDNNNNDIFQVTTFHPHRIIRSGSSITQETELFAGPKELALLEEYSRSMKILFFDRAVDFGILYVMTKPISRLLQIFYRVVGNFGVAIILLTLFIRLLMLPLSVKSGVSMVKIKELQPEILKIKKLYKDDKIALNKASVALFKKYNVTPMSGCLPTILQVPVFFALYKVIFITIEMRQAPFFLWIKDLSLPDPTNLFTLFGLLDWNCPTFLSIGILPILLGLTMIVQQNLTPSQYEDGTQAFMIKSMPYVFMLLFANFPSGLVLYWVFNNILSVLQQFAIGRYLLSKHIKQNASRAEKTS